MQLKFAVYNCGTGYNRSDNDIVAQLNRETISLHMITDGPGSTGIFRLGGLIGGVGVDANVDLAVEEIKSRNTVASMVVSMCGWSRGAVTCFKIANELHQSTETRNIPVNIFAIDPVPGGSAINNHMWRGIGVTPNVRMCQVVLSQHDRRSLFAPYYPPVLGPFTDVDLMPGDHSTICEPKGTRVEAFELVKDMAKRFLTGRGITFRDATLLKPGEILTRYAKIAESFDDYAHHASGAPWFRSNRFDGARVIKDVNRQVMARILPVKPAFFLNEHHRVTFRELYPKLTNEIDRSPEAAFTAGRERQWMPEFDRLMGENVEQCRMVLFYIMGCRARQAA